MSSRPQPHRPRSDISKESGNVEQPHRELNDCEVSERSREAEKSLEFKKHGIGRHFGFITYIKKWVLL